MSANEAIQIADHVRKNDLAGSVTVCLDRTNRPTGHVEETLELALSMVKTPRTRPAIGTGKNRAIAVGLPDAGYL
ncbi:hypothetical protein D3C80_1848280 [compost metagenome]